MVSLTVRRREEHRRMPWKNGLGVTEEIAIAPEGATLADPFLWRLSSALVQADGPFSLFPGYDRTLVVIDGAGMTLDADGKRTTIARLDAPFVFPGEASVTSALSEGPIRDFNVMALRGKVRSRTQLFRPSEGTGGETFVTAAGETTIVVCLDGSCAAAVAETDARPVFLHGLDALFVTGVTEVVRMSLGGDGVAAVVHIAVL
jgi:environmental stress-induced protein Ves